MLLANRHLMSLGLAVAAFAAYAAPAPRFPPVAVWHQDIRSAPLHAQSASMIATLVGLGGWGNGNRMAIDFSLHVFHDAPPDTPLHPVVASPANGYYAPDCEALPATMPVPAGAAFEGQSGLSCNPASADCHLLVQQGNTLYEIYNGNLVGGNIQAMCLAVWDLSALHPPENRGDHCTSADAAGFPIAPLLVNADGIAALLANPDGDLGHAIRFILPNARMASDVSLGGVGGRLYVRPASHAGGPSGPATSVPYGARLRLRGDFDMTGYNAAARVVLRTMQRYGIVLSDGGNIALTFESDRHTTTTWSALGITPQTFWSGSPGNRRPLAVGDFDVIDTGPRIAETYNCVRAQPQPYDVIFTNGFDAGRHVVGPAARQ